MINLFKNKTKFLKITILLFVAGILNACDKQTVYHAFQSIPQEGWKRQDTLFFNVSIPDSQTYYKLTIEVRNRNTYPYQNINLSVCYDSPEVKKLQADSRHSQRGRHLERRWLGRIISIRIPCRKYQNREAR